MLGKIIQRREKKTETEKEEPHSVLLRLDDADHDKLKHLCRLGDTNKNNILRQLIRFAYDVEFKKGGVDS